MAPSLNPIIRLSRFDSPLTTLQALQNSKNFFLLSPERFSVRKSSLSIKIFICFWTVLFSLVLRAWGLNFHKKFFNKVSHFCNPPYDLNYPYNSINLTDYKSQRETTSLRSVSLQAAFCVKPIRILLIRLINKLLNSCVMLE